MRPLEVAVAGGGIIGLACARALTLAGWRVEVFDAGHPPASLAAAGLLAPIFEPSAPLALLDAGREARDLWGQLARDLAAETGLPVDHDRGGTLAIVIDDEDEAELTGLQRAAAATGEKLREVAPAEARREIPDLAPAVRRVVLFPGEQRLDNVQAHAALAASLQRRGVPVHCGWSLARVDPSPRDVRLTFDHAAGSTVLTSSCLLLAAGAWSGQIAGLPAIPVRPVRGQMIRYEDVEWPWAGVIRAAGGYAVRRGRSGLLVGATVEEAGFTAVTTGAGLTQLRAFAGRLFPALAPRCEAAAWAGLRPGTPDGLPLLGRLADLPVWVATGHYRSGILLAPWTAREVTMAIVAGAPSSAGPFSPLRFAPPPASDGCRADHGV